MKFLESTTTGFAVVSTGYVVASNLYLVPHIESDQQYHRLAVINAIYTLGVIATIIVALIAEVAG